MNYLLVLLALGFIALFMFSGEKIEKIPAKLKSSAKSFASGNQMIVGILVGLALCWVIGLFIKTEGFEVQISDTGDNPFMIIGDNGQSITPGYIGRFWEQTWRDPMPPVIEGTGTGTSGTGSDLITALATWKSGLNTDTTLNVTNGDIQLTFNGPQPVQSGTRALQVRYAALIPTSFFDEVKSVIIDPPDDQSVITTTVFTDLGTLRNLMDTGVHSEPWFNIHTQNMYTLVELRRELRRNTSNLGMKDILRHFHSIIKLSEDYPGRRDGTITLKQYIDELMQGLDTRLSTSRPSTIPAGPSFSEEFVDKLLFLIDLDPSTFFTADNLTRFNTDLQSKLQLRESDEYLIYINYGGFSESINYDVIFKINNTTDGVEIGETGSLGPETPERDPSNCKEFWDQSNENSDEDRMAACTVILEYTGGIGETIDIQYDDSVSLVGVTDEMEQGVVCCVAPTAGSSGPDVVVSASPSSVDETEEGGEREGRTPCPADFNCGPGFIPTGTGNCAGETCTIAADQETCCQDICAEPSVGQTPPTKAQIMGHLIDSSLLPNAFKNDIIGSCCPGTGKNIGGCMSSIGSAYANISEESGCQAISPTFNFPYNENQSGWVG